MYFIGYSDKDIRLLVLIMPKRGLNVPENDIDCEFFTVISIDYLLVYEDEYYLHVHLDN